ncbi:unnamed protein product [Brassica oleracea]
MKKTHLNRSLAVFLSPIKLSHWLDGEKNFSMVLQAVRGPGHDVPRCFFKLVEKRNRLNGENIHLIERRTELREFIVSDSCFPLLPWLLTPYQGKPLPVPQTQFNRSHCETTKPGHMELWKLKDTWRIINGVMWRPDRNMLPKMIFVCCLLHNILLDMDDQTLDDSLLYHQHDVVFYDHSSL